MCGFMNSTAENFNSDFNLFCPHFESEKRGKNRFPLFLIHRTLLAYRSVLWLGLMACGTHNMAYGDAVCHGVARVLRHSMELIDLRSLFEKAWSRPVLKDTV